ncbi:hypothetical protein DV515_00018783, partial [Chloebia gouldiae]
MSGCKARFCCCSSCVKKHRRRVSSRQLVKLNQDFRYPEEACSSSLGTAAPKRTSPGPYRISWNLSFDVEELQSEDVSKHNLQRSVSCFSTHF